MIQFSTGYHTARTVPNSDGKALYQGLIPFLFLVFVLVLVAVVWCRILPYFTVYE